MAETVVYQKEVSEKAPDFEADAFWRGREEGETYRFRLQNLRGKKVVLAFYPGDFTLVCTKEMCEFQENLNSLSGLNAQVVGISVDSLEKHKKFAEKYDLDFPLIADTKQKVGQLYGVRGPLLGRSHRRALFVLDESGSIRWKHVEMSALFRTEVEVVAAILDSLSS